MMKRYVRLLFKYIAAVRFIPIIFFFFIFNKKKKLTEERDQWYDIIFPDRKKDFSLFIDLLNLSEYRSVLYYRLGGWSSLIRWCARGQYALYINYPLAELI